MSAIKSVSSTVSMCMYNISLGSDIMYSCIRINVNNLHNIKSHTPYTRLHLVGLQLLLHTFEFGLKGERPAPQITMYLVRHATDAYDKQVFGIFLRCMST